MGRLPLPDGDDSSLSVVDKQTLLLVARDSIKCGVDQGRALIPAIETVTSEALLLQRASFVTLRLDGQLRGCIGHLQAHQPLVQDVAENAFSAAFSDPRFNPLSCDELDRLELHISVLTKPETMHFVSETDLLKQIKQGIDGLILNDGTHRATFLPAVWQSLPNKTQFLIELKHKAGLPSAYWSDSIVIERYETIEFGRAIDELQ